MKVHITRTSRLNAVKLAIILVSVVLCGLTYIQAGRRTALAASEGPSPSYTGAPGEDNCTSCHVTFPVNSGPGSVKITGLPHDYLPGEQFPVTVTVTDPGPSVVIWGFQVTAIDSNGAAAGTFAVPEGGTSRMQIKTGFAAGQQRWYVEHTSAGTQPTAFGSNNWTLTWTAPSQRVGKVSFYAAGNAANSNAQATGDYIYTGSAATLAGSAVSNFDGDQTSDIAYFRPSTATWYSVSIQSPDTPKNIQFGVGSDRVVAGDYDGDGRTDMALYRPTTGEWRIRLSATNEDILVPWGSPGDIPVAGDYDGDGRTDQAVFRPSTGEWFLNESTMGSVTVGLGRTGDKPVQGDYDGDGRTDIGVFRPSDGTWYLVRSTAGPLNIQDGVSGDQPVQSDYDGDGLTDIARFRQSTATWYLNRSRAGAITIQFGRAWDRPVAADYDGDGLTDLAVFSAARKRVAPAWRIQFSSNQNAYDLVLGRARDIPVASSYFPK